MMWPFKRKPAPPNPGPINEDWAYGDLAENIASSEWITARKSGEIVSSYGLAAGDVCKVLDVEPRYNVALGARWTLELGGYPGKHYDATCFRKVPPLNSAADAEFTALIKSKRPVRA